MTQEIWKDAVGYEGLYKVSNLGRIYSIPRPSTKGGIMKPNIDKDGYYRVNLHKNGKKRFVSIHRLVAEAFISNFEKKLTVNHIDGNKLNNIVENLEWATYSEQLIHSFKHNLRKKTCNNKRKGVIVFQDNSYLLFDSITDLCHFLGYNIAYCRRMERIKGSVFYLKDKLIILCKKNENYHIMSYSEGEWYVRKIT